MKVIYKWYLRPFSSTTIINMHESFEILSIQKQGEHMILWALGNLNNPPYESRCVEPERIIHMFGTGNPIDPKIIDFNKLKFIDTVQDEDLVWHFFEEIK